MAFLQIFLYLFCNVMLIYHVKIILQFQENLQFYLATIAYREYYKRLIMVMQLNNAILTRILERKNKEK